MILRCVVLLCLFSLRIGHCQDAPTPEGENLPDIGDILQALSDSGPSTGGGISGLSGRLGAGTRGPGPLVNPGSPCAEFDQRRLQLLLETSQRIEPIRQLINIGHRALSKRFFEEAIESFRSAIRVAEDLQGKWNGLMKSLVDDTGGRSDIDYGCTLVLSRSLSQNVELKDLLHEVYPLLGRAHFETGKYPEAVREIQKAVLLHPEDPSPWEFLGTAQIMAGQFNDAVQSFQRAVLLDSYQPGVFYKLAVAHSQLRDVDRALFYLRRSITRGFTRFEQIETDARFANLRGDVRFEDLVYHGPGSPY